MKNKILVQLLVPDIEEKYDVFIPINKKIGNIILLLAKSVRELDDNEQIKDTSCLYNRDTGVKYNPDLLIIDSDIRNGTTLVLM